MKNSDMKIIAIILSIALFFTIVTSNAVSIASVIFLSKDATVAADGNGTGDAGNASTGNTSTGNTSTGNTSTGNTSTNTNAGTSTSTNTNANTSTNTNANTSTNTNTNTNTNTDANANTNTDANADANKDTNADANADAGNDAILADPLAAFQKASKEINQNGIAGYTKKGWQAVEGQLQLSKANFLAGTLTNLISGFMTTEADAEEKINEKGSDDAKNRMPAGDASASYIKSATAVKEGDNYVVTVVMNDQVNPSYDDTDGLVKMSREFLDIKDVVETVETDATVSKIVSRVDGTINYKAYTITAKMNAKGEFIEIKHYGVGDINADVTAVGVGDLQASGALSFNALYYNFVY